MLADFPATSRANRAAPGSGAGDVTEARAAFESQAIEKAQRRADVTALHLDGENQRRAGSTSDREIRCRPVAASSAARVRFAKAILSFDLPCLAYRTIAGPDNQLRSIGHVARIQAHPTVGIIDLPIIIVPLLGYGPVAEVGFDRGSSGLPGAQNVKTPLSAYRIDREILEFELLVWRCMAGVSLYGGEGVE